MKNKIIPIIIVAATIIIVLLFLIIKFLFLNNVVNPLPFPNH
jgi:hypothetical protein